MSGPGASPPTPLEAPRTLAGVNASAIGAVVFDVGGVLIDWDPRYLYRKMIPEESDMERFLAEVCTPDWHAQHDRGASYDVTVPELVAAHPEWTAEIQAWSSRFLEMYGGVFEGTVTLLAQLRGRIPLIASTNWGAESWALAKNRHGFLSWFDGALVSGEVGMAKPDPAFFELLESRFDLHPPTTLYIEDNMTNLEAAAAHGFVTHAFVSPESLGEELRHRGLLPQPDGAPTPLDGADTAISKG
jgi:2-haloacid dehalogenase